MSDLNEERELALLLGDLAPTDEARLALLEEHRQLEKDLFRLGDPLPPPNFVHQVLARVEARPVAVRVEVVSAAAILAAALAVAATGIAWTGVGASAGVELAQFAVAARELAVGLGSGLGALWRTAAGPMVAVLSMMLVAMLATLRRLAVLPARTR